MAFRILSLDGGGLLGAFTASVLATFEKQCQKTHGKALVDHFDLITGTSTGGLIAIALAMGTPAEQILDFYRNQGRYIFPRSGRVRGWVKTLRTLFRPKFSPKELRKAVIAVVGEKPLREALTRLVIPVYQASPLGRPYLFKTPHDLQRAHHADVAAADVALATSAAPTYFPAHSVKGFGVFIDGGVWANCPSRVGVVEAVAFCKQPLTEIEMLSISTTNYPFAIQKEAQLGGYLGWAPTIIETFMFSQIQASVNEAQCLLGKDRFHRIDFLTIPNTWIMDDPNGIDDLIIAGQNAATLVDTVNTVMLQFLNGSTINRPMWIGGPE